MAKYIDAEQIRAEIVRRMEIYGNPCGAGSLYDIRKKHALAGLLDFLDTLPEQPVEGLEEEADKYSFMHSGFDPEDGEYDVYDHEKREAFIAGAEWQKAQDQKTIELAEDHAMLAGMNKMEQQMMEKAVEGEVHPDDCEIWVNLVGYGYKFKDGDKVKIIIVKEDQK